MENRRCPISGRILEKNNTTGYYNVKYIKKENQYRAYWKSRFGHVRPLSLFNTPEEAEKSLMSFELFHSAASY
jgi:hypothetical protein